MSNGRAIEVLTWPVHVWARICWLLSFVVGVQRAERWARAGAVRFVRYRYAGYEMWHRSTCRLKPGHDGRCS